jgi:hypothetical protein
LQRGGQQRLAADGGDFRDRALITAAERSSTALP